MLSNAGKLSKAGYKTYLCKPRGENEFTMEVPCNELTKSIQLTLARLDTEQGKCSQHFASVFVPLHESILDMVRTVVQTFGVTGILLHNGTAVEKSATPLSMNMQD